MINPYLLSFVFSLFLIPSIVFAQEKIDYDIEKLYKETQLLPLEGSPYTGEFVAVTMLRLYFSDNLKYGLRFSRNFLDAGDKSFLKKSGDIRNLMNLHNNEAGRRASTTF